MSPEARVHRLLTDRGSGLRDGPLGRLYRLQRTRVRELLAALEQADPAAARAWRERDKQRAMNGENDA